MADAGVPREARECEKCGKPPGPSVSTALADEPITHCEWCGAEYPEPDHDTEAHGDEPGR